MEHDDQTPKSAPEARRPYVKPRIEESTSFEHLVLGCGFSSAAVDSCNKRLMGVPYSS